MAQNPKITLLEKERKAIVVFNKDELARYGLLEYVRDKDRKLLYPQPFEIRATELFRKAHPDYSVMRPMISKYNETKNGPEVVVSLVVSKFSRSQTFDSYAEDNPKFERVLAPELKFASNQKKFCSHCGSQLKTAASPTGYQYPPEQNNPPQLSQPNQGAGSSAMTSGMGSTPQEDGSSPQMGETGQGPSPNPGLDTPHGMSECGCDSCGGYPDANQVPPEKLIIIIDLGKKGKPPEDIANVLDNEFSPDFIKDVIDFSN